MSFEQSAWYLVKGLNEKDNWIIDCLWFWINNKVFYTNVFVEEIQSLYLLMEVFSEFASYGARNY